jgi:hypothetical protein
MAYDYTQFALAQISANGLNFITSYTTFYIGLIQSPGVTPDPTLDYVTDITPHFADYKGYAEQAVTPTVSFDAFTETGKLTFSTATFPYDSTASGTSSNTITGFYCAAWYSGTYYLLLVSDISPNWVVAADGDVPTIPLTFTMAQKVPCP